MSIAEESNLDRSRGASSSGSRRRWDRSTSGMTPVLQPVDTDLHEHVRRGSGATVTTAINSTPSAPAAVAEMLIPQDELRSVAEDRIALEMAISESHDMTAMEIAKDFRLIFRGFNAWKSVSSAVIQRRTAVAAGSYLDHGPGVGITSAVPHPSRGGPLPVPITAVAGAGSSGGNTQVFPVEYFLQWQGWTDTCKQHNVALKYFRDYAEEYALTVIHFTNTAEGNPVAQIVHEKGPNYHFVGEPTIPWNWQEMVAQMDEHSMRWIVQGLQEVANPRSRGLVSCRLQMTDCYDHQRHSALKKDMAGSGKKPPSADMLRIWDFVLVCEDGTEVGLHTNFSDKKIACYLGAAAQDHELPRSGKGGTSGRGTFKYFKNKRCQMTLKFDGSKRPVNTFRVHTFSVAR